MNKLALIVTGAGLVFAFGLAVVSSDDRDSASQSDWWKTISVRYIESKSGGNPVGIHFTADEVAWLVVDEDGDGVYEECRLTDKDGVLIRVKDRNGDRKLDWWYRRDSPTDGRMAIDTNYDGIADEFKDVAIVGP